MDSEQDRQGIVPTPLRLRHEMDVEALISTHFGHISLKEVRDQSEERAALLLSLPSPTFPPGNEEDCSPLFEVHAETAGEPGGRKTKKGAETKPHRDGSLSPSSWIYVTPPPTSDSQCLRNLKQRLRNCKRKTSTVSQYCFYCYRNGHRISNCPKLTTTRPPVCRALDFSNMEDEPELPQEAGTEPKDTVLLPSVIEFETPGDTFTLHAGSKKRGRKQKLNVKREAGDVLETQVEMEKKQEVCQALLDHNYCLDRY